MPEGSCSPSGSGMTCNKPPVYENSQGRGSKKERTRLRGVRRETLEETGLDVAVRSSLGVHSFMRDNGQ